MYDIVHTDAYVLSERDEGEANKIFLVFTRELGVISLHAQSIRKGTSKLKSLLQPYKKIHTDIVVGKKIFRVASVISGRSFVHLFENKYKRKVFTDTFKILLKLIPRQVPVPEIFDFYDEMLFEIEYANTISDIKKIESMFLWNTLNLLGYIDEISFREVYTILSPETLFEEIQTGTLIKYINKTFEKMHL